MGISLTNNIAALTTSRQLAQTNASMNSSLERLSSGYRINRASDDPSGLAISESLRSQTRGMTQSLRNAQDGVSVVQIADGALGQTTAVLQRMRDLTVQAANDGALGSDDKLAVQKEIDQLKLDLGRIAGGTQFDGIPLLDGTYDRTFQVGANVGETLQVAIGAAGQKMDATGLGLSALDITGADGTTGAAITAIDGAITQVTSTRADLGALQNRFEDTVDRVSLSLQNTTASESRIRDSDVAAEMATYARTSILTQAGTAMLTQATHAPDALLKLLS
jgi:flagellin